MARIAVCKERQITESLSWCININRRTEDARDVWQTDKRTNGQNLTVDRVAGPCCWKTWLLVCSQSSFQIRTFHMLLLFLFVCFLPSPSPLSIVSSVRPCVVIWSTVTCLVALLFFIIVGEPKFKRFSSHLTVFYFLLMLQVGALFYCCFSLKLSCGSVTISRPGGGKRQTRRRKHGGREVKERDLIYRSHVSSCHVFPLIWWWNDAVSTASAEMGRWSWMTNSKRSWPIWRHCRN
jgi:hypothetical protein